MKEHTGIRRTCSERLLQGVLLPEASQSKDQSSNLGKNSLLSSFSTRPSHHAFEHIPHTLQQLHSHNPLNLIHANQRLGRRRAFSMVQAGPASQLSQEFPAAMQGCKKKAGFGPRSRELSEDRPFPPPDPNRPGSAPGFPPCAAFSSPRFSLAPRHNTRRANPTIPGRPPRSRDWAEPEGCARVDAVRGDRTGGGGGAREAAAAPRSRRWPRARPPIPGAAAASRAPRRAPAPAAPARPPPNRPAGGAARGGAGVARAATAAAAACGRRCRCRWSRRGEAAAAASSTVAAMEQRKR